MKLYIVGGAVRDMLLGKTPTDVDMAFCDPSHAHTGTLQKVGKSVNVYLCQGHEYMPLKDNSLIKDLHSRDFTINAMALPLSHVAEEHDAFYAHPLAMHDLACGILRPASETSFFDDALRIYRAARFAATLSQFSGMPFSVHESSIMQGQAVVGKGLHASLPAERVGREVIKALHGPWPWRFFEIITQMRALDPWFRELKNTHMRHMPAITHATAMQHWLSLCTVFARENTPQQAHSLAMRLCLPKKYVEAGYIMACCHKDALRYSSLFPHEQCDLLRRIDKAHLSSAFWHPTLHPESDKALHALACIKRVRLPKKWQNKGVFSGQYLRALQCETLKQI